jgi:hypothetical protein
MSLSISAARPASAAEPTLRPLLLAEKLDSAILLDGGVEPAVGDGPVHGPPEVFRDGIGILVGELQDGISSPSPASMESSAAAFCTLDRLPYRGWAAPSVPTARVEDSDREQRKGSFSLRPSNRRTAQPGSGGANSPHHRRRSVRSKECMCTSQSTQAAGRYDQPNGPMVVAGSISMEGKIHVEHAMTSCAACLRCLLLPAG